MKNKLYSLLKLFFPSWSFFGGATDTPYLLVNTTGQFKPVFPPPKTKLTNLFYNPHGNLYLAHHSNMQALLNDIFQGQDRSNFNLEETPSYQIAKNWVEYYLHQTNLNIKKYNFKFSYVNFNQNQIEIIEDIFISPEYEL